MSIDELKIRADTLWLELQATKRVSDRKSAEWQLAECDVKDAEAAAEAAMAAQPGGEA